jgi:hypothetical protein
MRRPSGSGEGGRHTGPACPGARTVRSKPRGTFRNTGRIRDLKLIASVAGLLFVASAITLSCQRGDSKLSAEATAAALQRQLGTDYRFHCTEEENDGSIELRGVDYFCQPNRPSEAAYWVATDGSRITGTQSSG